MSVAETASARSAADAPQRTWGEWLAWIFTEDHCEWANAYVATVKTPLGVLVVGAICSLLCGLFVAPQGYVLLGAIAAVIGVGLAWPAIAVRGIRCRFVFEASRGREGQTSAAEVVVTNRWPWPVWGLAINDPLLADGEQSALALARVGGWSASTFRCALKPTLRGVYPRREPRVSTGFPFGLYRASRRVDVPRRLIVWPETFWLPPLGAAAERPHWRGAVTDSRVGHDGTRLGVREHRVGDSLRDVHWAKTARYDRLIVSERESATAEDATVLVGLVTDDAGRPAEDPTLEWRLRIAASVCESFAATRGRVTLWLGGKRLTAGAAAGDLDRLMDDLARFDPSDTGGPSPRRRRETSGVAIAVDAERSSIVVRRFWGAAAAGGASPTRPAWITIDSLVDVPGRVLRGWRTGRRGCGSGR